MLTISVKIKYLLAYNLILAIGWAVFLVLFILRGCQLDETTLLLLNICQGAAVLEIVHAILRWVSTPVFTAFVQVFSRILVLVFINILPTEEIISVLGLSGIVLVAFAWGITEIIRYSYYFFSLLKKEVYVLTFLRYTLFIILYPIGVFGEWLILLTFIKLNGWEFNLGNALMAVVLFSYLPLFPKLYKYMWAQRSKKLA